MLLILILKVIGGFMKNNDIKKEEEITFEQAVSELEQIVAKLEGGKFPLEESANMFQCGVELSQYCNKMLDETEQKITKLIDGGEILKETPFKVE